MLRYLIDFNLITEEELYLLQFAGFFYFIKDVEFGFGFTSTKSWLLMIVWKMSRLLLIGARGDCVVFRTLILCGFYQNLFENDDVS